MPARDYYDVQDEFAVGDRVLAPDLDNPGSLELLVGTVRAVWEVEGADVCLVAHTTGIRRHWYARNLLPLRPVEAGCGPARTSLSAGGRVRIRDASAFPGGSPKGTVLRVARVGHSNLALVRHDCGKLRHWHAASLVSGDAPTTHAAADVMLTV